MNDLKYIAYIALGGNLSNPKDNFCRAVQALEDLQVQILDASSLWHSPAWPAGEGHPDYVNAVIKVCTSLVAKDLLSALHEIEKASGRIRSVLNAPRALDLDLIDFASQVNEIWPILPHPRLLDRPFVLLPLMEVSKDWRHPTQHYSALEALSRLPLENVWQHFVLERKWLKSVTCF